MACAVTIQPPWDVALSMVLGGQVNKKRNRQLNLWAGGKANRYHRKKTAPHFIISVKAFVNNTKQKAYNATKQGRYWPRWQSIKVSTTSFLKFFCRASDFDPSLSRCPLWGMIMATLTPSLNADLSQESKLRPMAGSHWKTLMLALTPNRTRDKTKLGMMLTGLSYGASQIALICWRHYLLLAACFKISWRALYAGKIEGRDQRYNIIDGRAPHATFAVKFYPIRVSAH